jgi:hypothetical protein
MKAKGTGGTAPRQQYIRCLPSRSSRFVPGIGSAMVTGWVSDLIWMFRRREKCLASAGKRTMSQWTSSPVAQSLYQLRYPGSLLYYYNSTLLILLAVALVLRARSFVHGGLYVFTDLLSFFGIPWLSQFPSFAFTTSFCLTLLSLHSSIHSHYTDIRRHYTFPSLTQHSSATIFSTYGALEMAPQTDWFQRWTCNTRITLN